MSEAAAGTGAYTASLPMYGTHPGAVEAFWRALSRHLRDSGIRQAPRELLWPQDVHAHWLSPSLLLSQACGYPLVTFLAGRVRVVGAFHYDAPGCRGALQHSQLVVRSNDPATTPANLRGRTVAYNSTDSQSGYNALRALVAPLAVAGRFFGHRHETGAHLESVLAVRDGRADVAAIDCVSLAGFMRHRPDSTHGLRALTQTAAYPGLPLVTALETDNTTLAALRTALHHATRDPSLQAIRNELFMTGFEPLDADAYQTCRDMHAQRTATQRSNDRQRRGLIAVENQHVTRRRLTVS